MGESHSYKLHSYMKNSAAYGVKYIITSSHTNEISSRMKQEISERVSLSLKDKYDYSDILNCKVSYIPPEIPGRGLVNVDGRPLEFQSGIIYANFDEKTRNKQLRDLCDFLCELYGNKHSAQQLAVTSETAEFSDFAMQFKPGRIPLGYSGQMKKPIALPLKQFSTLGIYFGNPIGKQKIIDNLMFAAQNENMELWVIKKSKNSIFANDKLDISKCKDADELVCSQENIRILQTALLSVMTNQRDVLEKYYSENNLIENIDSFAKAYGTLNELTKPIMLFIDSISEFCENTSDFLLMGFSNLFSKAKFRNVYIIGCMEPNDDENNLNNELVSVFAKGESLLFGGNFDKQKVYSLPEGVRYMKQIPYNTAVFQYRKKWFDLLMPCGNIEEEFVDEDIMDIIE